MESGGGNGSSGNVAEVGWLIQCEDQQHIGPYTVSELREHFLIGYLTESTLVWSEGSTEWQPLSAIPGVISGISQQGMESGGGNGSSGNVVEVGWLIHCEDHHIGPYFFSDLRAHFLSGYLTGSTLVWSEGMTEWQPLSAAIPGVIAGISQQVPLPSTYGDEYEQWQEVMEAEAHAQAEMLKVDSNKLDDIAERPSMPPDGEEEFTDDDGTTNKWDRVLRALIPLIDYVDLKKHAPGFILLIRLKTGKKYVLRNIQSNEFDNLFCYIRQKGLRIMNILEALRVSGCFTTPFKVIKVENLFSNNILFKLVITYTASLFPSAIVPDEPVFIIHGLFAVDTVNEKGIRTCREHKINDPDAKNFYRSILDKKGAFKVINKHRDWHILWPAVGRGPGDEFYHYQNDKHNYLWTIDDQEFLHKTFSLGQKFIPLVENAMIANNFLPGSTTSCSDFEKVIEAAVGVKCDVRFRRLSHHQDGVFFGPEKIGILFDNNWEPIDSKPDVFNIEDEEKLSGEVPNTVMFETFSGNKEAKQKVLQRGGKFKRKSRGGAIKSGNGGGKRKKAG